MRPGDVLSCATAQEKRDPGVAPRRRHVQGAVELVDDKGEVPCTWHHQPADARAPSRVPRPRRRAQAPRASAGQPLGRAAAPDAAPGPMPSSRTASIGEITDLGRPHLQRATRSSPSPASSIRSRSISTRTPPRPRCSARCAPRAGTRRRFHPRRRHHAAGRQRRRARRGQRLPTTARRPASANCAGSSRSMSATPSPIRAPAGREDRSQVAPRARPAGEQVQGRNQKGEIVFSVISQILAERREPFRP